jgi:hypothetical protein
MSSFPVGRLNRSDAEPGTLLGPDSMGQLLVVTGRDDSGVTCSYAGLSDVEAAHQRDPRSVTEARAAAVFAARHIPALVGPNRGAA